MSSPIVAPWLRLFGSSPIDVRAVLATALDPSVDPGLREAIATFLPHPDPTTLSKYLHLVEDRPFKNGTATLYRFTRMGHRWRLVEVPG